MRNLSSLSSSSGKQKDGGMKRGPWTPEEDQLLSSYINQHGEGRWRTLPNRAGLLRCGKSCRLRWMNYLRPCVKRGHISPDEEDLILRLHRLLGNRWSLIAGRIPGHTDNEIKNYWNTHLSKKLIRQGIDPTTHRPLSSTTQNPLHNSTWLTTCAHADQHNNNLNAAAASRLPADPLHSSVSPAQSDQNNQELYYGGGGTELDNDQFELSTTTAGKAKCLQNYDNVDDDDVFLSSLVNYEQIFNQHDEPADACSHAFAFGSAKWDKLHHLPKLQLLKNSPPPHPK